MLHICVFYAIKPGAVQVCAHLNPNHSSSSNTVLECPSYTYDLILIIHAALLHNSTILHHSQPNSLQLIPNVSAAALCEAEMDFKNIQCGTISCHAKIKQTLNNAFSKVGRALQLFPPYALLIRLFAAVSRLFFTFHPKQK